MSVSEVTTWSSVSFHTQKLNNATVCFILSAGLSEVTIKNLDLFQRISCVLATHICATPVYTMPGIHLQTLLRGRMQQESWISTWHLRPSSLFGRKARDWLVLIEQRMLGISQMLGKTLSSGIQSISAVRFLVALWPWNFQELCTKRASYYDGTSSKGLVIWLWQVLRGQQLFS